MNGTDGREGAEEGDEGRNGEDGRYGPGGAASIFHRGPDSVSARAIPAEHEKRTIKTAEQIVFMMEIKSNSGEIGKQYASTAAKMGRVSRMGEMADHSPRAILAGSALRIFPMAGSVAKKAQANEAIQMSSHWLMER